VPSSAENLRSEIEERLEAVEEIMHKTDDVASALVKLLEELPDLGTQLLLCSSSLAVDLSVSDGACPSERIISRAYFRKVSPSEFLYARDWLATVRCTVVI
jgi:NTP pyrophosphatase (non-canonical NTP hydrolase)